MGKCINCGNETANSYSFKAGKCINSSTSKNVVTSEYRIMEVFNEFACSKCIYPIKKTLLYMGIALLAAGAGIFISTFAKIGEGITVFSGLFLFVSLIQIFMGIYYRIYPNKRVSNRKGSEYVSDKKQEAVKARYPGCTIIVPKK